MARLTSTELSDHNNALFRPLVSLLNDVVPDNVLSIVHEQASRIASNSGRALSIGFVVGILVSLWSAMSGVKAMIDALNVIYEQKEGRSVLKLNLVALVFTLAGFAANCSE
jgi:membrane protein